VDQCHSCGVHFFSPRQAISHTRHPPSSPCGAQMKGKQSSGREGARARQKNWMMAPSVLSTLGLPSLFSVRALLGNGFGATLLYCRTYRWFSLPANGHEDRRLLSRKHVHVRRAISREPVPKVGIRTPCPPSDAPGLTNHR
jgi:hypothetical protein